MENGMEVITYSLRNGQADAAQYYRDVSAFTEEVLTEANDRLAPLLDGFNTYWLSMNGKMKRTRFECVFELLTLGVLWNGYMTNALALNPLFDPLLEGLVRLREKGGKLKPLADRLRRISNTLLFNSRHLLTSSDQPRLDRLLRWLRSTGDYSPQVRRLRDWEGYFATLPPDAPGLSQVLAFAAWFESASQAALGCYTARVETFRAKTRAHYRWREDIVFCSRPPVEYHLNMVGGELLNWAYRADFLATERKVVIVPPCMRLRGEDGCKAVATPLGSKCAACAAECRVNKLTQLGEQCGFAVRIMGDLEVYSPGGAPAAGLGRQHLGVVGVSCVLTNAPGGWDARGLDIPAQGVPLDYCGCPWHWHDPGIPTDVDFRRILQVLGIDGIVRI
jgi:hypothetical protein